MCLHEITSSYEVRKYICGKEGKEVFLCVRPSLGGGIPNSAVRSDEIAIINCFLATKFEKNSHGQKEKI